MEGPTETSSAEARIAAAGVERYELALQAGRMGTWYWDVTANRIDWDDQLPRVFGLEPGQFDGSFESYLGLLHPDDVDATIASIQDSVATGRDHYVEHRVIHPDGSVHWVSGTGRPIVGPDGEVVAMVGVGADISEQHAAHEATRAAEAATAIAQDAAARSQARLALLGRVSGVLGASLDVAITLQQLADIVVHEGLADWCAVEVPGGTGTGCAGWRWRTVTRRWWSSPAGCRRTTPHSCATTKGSARPADGGARAVALDPSGADSPVGGGRDPPRADREPADQRRHRGPC